METSYPTKKLGEVCKIKKGKKPKLYTTQTETRLPYLGAKFMRGTKDAEYAEKADKNSVPVNKKDLIIICDGSRSGEVFSDFEGILSSTMGRIDPKHKEIDTKYLQNFLYIQFNLFNSGKKGAAIPHLDFNIFNNLEIPLPPLAEQKKIVAKLEKLLAKVNEAKKLRAEAQEATSQLLPAELHKIFEEGKKKGWEENELGELCELAQGLAINAKTKHLLTKKSSLPLLRIKDLREGTHSQYVREEGYPKQALVGEDDLLYTRTGQIGLVFRGRNGVLHNNSFKVTPGKKISRDFMFWFLQEPSFKAKIVTLSSRTAQPDITHKNFKAQKISYPPLSEQKKIVARLDSISEKSKQLQEHQKATSNDLLALEQSILSKAFSGEFV